ncbi:putative integral membrane protein [Bacillus ectoiniformans]|uniref:LapA family protein n=1 Tax=Bacillus ectoiniformans TaxID=1494429 RepID=UPI001958A135|nr:lipopolysaccharide assembly protein LapA domain-containing protein [Bacillus ectoiniformans]MBM7648993.1 putative integral membrane protein [Bacillus ectoiniformans]
MKTQTTLLLSVLFAIVIAIFAVINVEPVTVNYLFGQSEWPLVLVIIFSVFMGALLSFLLSLFRTLGLRRQNKVLIHQIENLKKELHELKQRNQTEAGTAKDAHRTIPDGE